MDKLHPNEDIAQSAAKVANAAARYHKTMMNRDDNQMHRNTADHKSEPEMDEKVEKAKKEYEDAKAEYEEKSGETIEEETSDDSDSQDNGDSGGNNDDNT